MAASALRIKDLGGELFSLPSLRLQGFLATVIGSWLFFPGAIFAGRAGLLDFAATEKVLIFANFAAKVSSQSSTHSIQCFQLHQSAMCSRPAAKTALPPGAKACRQEVLLHHG